MIWQSAGYRSSPLARCGKCFLLVLVVTASMSSLRELRAQDAPGRKELAEKKAGLYREAQRQRFARKPAEAVSLAKQVVSIETRLSGSTSYEVGLAMMWLAILQRENYDFAGAVVSLNASGKVMVRHVGKKDWRVVSAWNRMSEYKRLTSLDKSAQASFIRADKLLPVAKSHIERAKYREALPLTEQCVEIARQTAGPESRFYADCRMVQARLARQMGEYGKADGFYREAGEVLRGLVTELDPAYAKFLEERGDLHWDMREWEKAERFFQRSLAVFAWKRAAETNLAWTI